MITSPFTGTVPSKTTSVTAAGSALLNTLHEAGTSTDLAFNANLCALTLIPRPGVVVNWNIGAAAADDTTPELPTGGIHFPCTKAVADTIYVHSDTAGINLDVIQHI
jgi:hypothetical protein